MAKRLSAVRGGGIFHLPCRPLTLKLCFGTDSGPLPCQREGYRRINWNHYTITLKALIQRVAQARVDIRQHMAGSIAHGMLVFLGVEKGDTGNDLEYLVKKI